MKKQFPIINIILSAAIIFSILFQSFHSYEHFLTQISEKKCLHHSLSKSDITHQHKGFEKCFTCEFTFSNFLKATPQSLLTPINYNFEKTNSFFSTKINFFFSGISYSLRGPPLS